MSNWTFVKLGSLANFKNGLNFSKDNFGKGLKVIGVSDFKDYLYPRYDSLDEINPNGLVKDEDCLREGDILFVRSNGNRLLIGRSLYVKNLRERISHSGFTIRLRFNSPHVHRPFYVYLFKSSLMRSVLSLQGGGTNINNLNQKILSELKLPFPPLPVQKKIAAVLSAYDDLIENNTRRIVLLEKMAEEIYREWFVRLRFPGHKQTTFHKGIPEGWEVVKISQAFQITGGGTPSKDESQYWTDGNLNWYTPSDITASKGNFLFESSLKCNEEGLKNSSARMFPAYSVMMTSRATIGVVGINTTPACTNQGFITCIPNRKYPLAFLYHWLKLSKSHFEMLATGSTFAELSKNTFKKMEIVTPDKDLMNQFCLKVDPILETIEVLLRANFNLQQTRDRLLSRLISGKLSLEDLDIQFPPSTTDSPSPAQGQA